MIQMKVARVVSPTELILAAGAKDGVEEGMEFIVYTLSDSVWDPDTGEDLGQIEIVKAKLIAAHVQEHMTIARTKSQTFTRLNSYREQLRSQLLGEYQTTHVVDEKMAVEKVDAITNRDLIVRIGDLARTVNVPAKIRNRELVVA